MINEKKKVIKHLRSFDEESNSDSSYNIYGKVTTKALDAARQKYGLDHEIMDKISI